MSDAMARALELAIEDLNAGELIDPQRYLNLVPTDMRQELADRLSAVIAMRGPVEGADDPDDSLRAAAFSAVASVHADAGSTGILPGALKQMRRARGIERDAVVDALAEQFTLDQEARPTLRRYYHQLETGTLLGSRLTHRLLRALATIFEADPDDLIAGAQPVRRARVALSPAMGRGRDGPLAGGAQAIDGENPDKREDEAVKRLFLGGPDG